MSVFPADVPRPFRVRAVVNGVAPRIRGTSIAVEAGGSEIGLPLLSIDEQKRNPFRAPEGKEAGPR